MYHECVYNHTFLLLFENIMGTGYTLEPMKDSSIV